MIHGYESMNMIKKPPFLQGIGLSQGGNNYHFEGKLGDIIDFMTNVQPTLMVKTTNATPADPVCVDIHNIALSGVQEYQKAVVAAVPGANLLGALISAKKDKKVKIILRNGKTSPPVTSLTRFTVNSPIPLRDLADSIAEVLRGESGKRSKAMNIGVAAAKTGLKVLKSIN